MLPLRKFGVEDTFVPALDRVTDVGNGVFRQIGDRKPRKVAALVRLTVHDVSRPGGNMEKEIDAFVGKGMARHDVGERDLFRRDGNPRLFLSLADHAAERVFIFFLMSRHQPIFPIPITGVLTTEQENFTTLVSGEERINGWNEEWSWHIQYSLNITLVSDGIVGRAGLEPATCLSLIHI